MADTKAVPSIQLAVVPWLLLVALIVAGCRPITAEGALATPVTLPAADAGEAAPALDPALQALADAALAQLAAQLGVDPASLTVVSVEAVEWPDASLGCPEPDMMYAQVVTPGYRIVLMAGGQTIEVHTDAQQPPQVVTCES